MPIKGAKYRVHVTKTGKKIRLAFDKNGNVIESKNLDTGKVHTQAEFKKDRAKARKRKPVTKVRGHK